MNVLRQGRWALASIACLLGCARGVDANGAGSMATRVDASAGEGDAGDPVNESGTGPGLGDDATFPEEAGEAASADANPKATADASADAGDGAQSLPTLLSQQQVCKLINDAAEGDPTANQTPTLANLVGTDLGIPLEVGSSLYFFFGDSHGYKGIWQPGQSFPDAVGYSLDSATALAAKPGLLCSDLRFLTLSPSASLGPTIDPSIVADFAAAAMSAPSGQSLSTYIHNPSGDSQNSFPYLPGTSEVPSGTFAYGSDAYVFYTTVDSPTDPTMEASYLARWSSPSTQGTPGLNVLYSVDDRLGTGSPLFGDFVNVAAETSGSYLYLFGTGDFRKSPVRLARKALSSLASAGGFELYDAASGTWGTSRGAPIIATPGYGETSVHFFSAINRWMFLAADFDMHSQVVARFADQPEGPWSAPIVIQDMADPVFTSLYCCGQSCVGAQMLLCSGGNTFYGAYLLPEVAVQSDGSFTVDYTLSTGNPYDVVLMQATFSGP